MQKQAELYRGKAKTVYSTENPDVLSDAARTPYPTYVRQTNLVRITAKIAFSCRRTRLRIISEKRAG